MDFASMGLHPEILRAVAEEGYKQPTPIQEVSIPHVIEGRDLMACAQTGTGKTAAFMLPILTRLAAKPRATLRAIVLVPTRELAAQVCKNAQSYARHLDLQVTAVYGGVPFEPQEMMLRHGVDVLVATPGRLIDHMWRGNIDYRHTEVVVLDEADRMLDMGFIDDVRKIVCEIPTDRQTMLFSATLEPSIRRLAHDILRDPVSVEVARPSTPVEQVDQHFIDVRNNEDKMVVMEQLVRDHRMDRAIIFTRTKIGASRLASYLKGRGYRAAAIHGDRSQSERLATLEAFRSGRIHLLVATDVAARGLDVDDIGHVVNFDVPFHPEDYVHRIGRTARAGRKGTAITLVTSRERLGVQAIEKLIGKTQARSGRLPVPVVAATAARPANVAANGSANGNGNGNGNGRVSVSENGSSLGVGPAKKRRRRRRSGSAGVAVAAAAPAGRAAVNGTATATARRTRPVTAEPEIAVPAKGSKLFTAVFARVFRRRTETTSGN